MRLLVIEHEPKDPIGLLGEHWVDSGIELDIRHAWRGDTLPQRIDPGEHRGLVILGGYMGADDDAAHPWLTQTKALIRVAVAEDSPVLGICLGHQLMVSALGGRVARNPRGRTSGLHPIGWTEAGRTDDLLEAIPHDATVLHYNDDIAVELPATAVPLAVTADGSPQAVRYAPRAWGVQFHPEVAPATFASWSEVPSPMAEATYAAMAALRHTAGLLAARFAMLTLRPSRHTS
jgi:GMP synthase (glutamine-hydrolysing)